MKRTVRLVAEEPGRPHSKARMFAYGFRAIALLAGTSEKTVRRSVARGELDPASLASVVRFVNERPRNDREQVSEGQPTGSGRA